jgi:mannose/fructose-specific phosphotransferase system component IIA
MTDVSEKGILLSRIDFDGLENQVANAESTEHIAVFIDGWGGTAHAKASRYMTENPLVTRKVWSGGIYPKYVLTTITVNPTKKLSQPLPKETP